MSSQITPNSVNETFPVAGRDNNSQGFRDNFTAIKNNFTYTKREIDDLMNKAVVKSQLTYGPPIDNNFAGASIVGATLKKESYQYNALNTETASLTIDYAVGSQHIVNLGTAITNTSIAFTNIPQTGKYTEIRLLVSVQYGVDDGYDDEVVADALVEEVTDYAGWCVCSLDFVHVLNTH